GGTGPFKKTFYPQQSCADINFCATTTTTPPPFGACCVNNQNNYYCANNIPQLICINNYNATFYLNAICDDINCGPNTTTTTSTTTSTTVVPTTSTPINCACWQKCSTQSLGSFNIVYKRTNLPGCDYSLTALEYYSPPFGDVCVYPDPTSETDNCDCNVSNIPIRDNYCFDELNISSLVGDNSFIIDNPARSPEQNYNVWRNFTIDYSDNSYFRIIKSSNSPMPQSTIEEWQNQLGVPVNLQFTHPTRGVITIQVFLDFAYEDTLVLKCPTRLSPTSTTSSPAIPNCGETGFNRTTTTTSTTSTTSTTTTSTTTTQSPGACCLRNGANDYYCADNIPRPICDGPNEQFYANVMCNSINCPPTTTTVAPTTIAPITTVAPTTITPTTTVV
ncbi:hypothetical protein EBZ38_17200, partial [bacterium]|nr:hypothetical protein [bacterium]